MKPKPGLITQEIVRYIDESIPEKLIQEYNDVRKMLISMIDTPEKFCKRQ